MTLASREREPISTLTTASTRPRSSPPPGRSSPFDAGTGFAGSRHRTMVTPDGALIASALLEAIGRRSLSTWLAEAAAYRDAAGIEVAFDETTRHVGTAPLDLQPAECEQLRQLGVEWSLGSWSVDDAVRAALLSHASGRLDRQALQTLIERRWGAGDGRQRCAILRTLPLLASAERF